MEPRTTATEPRRTVADIVEGEIPEQQSLAVPEQQQRRPLQVPEQPKPQVPSFLEYSVETDKLLPALVKSALDFDAIEADRLANIRSDKGNFTYGWASLAEINRATRKPLARNDLLIIHGTRQVGNTIHVRTEIRHTSGQWIRNDLAVGVFGSDPREIGKAITYARRYNIMALLNLSPGEEEDDDGEQGATEAATTGSQPQAPRAEAPQAGRRKSEQTKDVAKQPDPAPALEPARPSEPVAHANVGRIVASEPRGTATFYALDTGLKFATKDEKLIEAMNAHKKNNDRIEVAVKQPAKAGFAMTLEEVVLVTKGDAQSV